MSDNTLTREFYVIHLYRLTADIRTRLEIFTFIGTISDTFVRVLHDAPLSIHDLFLFSGKKNNNLSTSPRYNGLAGRNFCLNSEQVQNSYVVAADNSIGLFE